jgi:hypothetical protein
LNADKIPPKLVSGLSSFSTKPNHAPFFVSGLGSE